MVGAVVGSGDGAGGRDGASGGAAVRLGCFQDFHERSDVSWSLLFLHGAEDRSVVSKASMSVRTFPGLSHDDVHDPC